MMKKLTIFLAVAVLCGGVAFGAMGGISWLDSMGLRGVERQAESRIHGYWEARRDSDAERMAQYAHPAETMIFEPGMLITEDYEIKDIEVEGDEATATVWVKSRIKHAMFSGKTREVTFDDGWVRVRGQWYKKPVPMTFKDAVEAQQGRWQPPTLENESAE